MCRYLLFVIIFDRHANIVKSIIKLKTNILIPSVFCLFPNFRESQLLRF